VTAALLIQALAVAAAGLVAAWLLTGLVRRYAVRTQLLDHPNERSSHSVPTPRGGGVGFVVAFLVLATGMAWAGIIERGLAAAIVGSGLLVAMLGFIDDRRPVPARWRFLGHAVAGVWVLWWLGPLPPVPMFGVNVNLSFAATALSWLMVVWLINVFNFMDGIDGIAGVEAVTVAAGGALLWWLAGQGTGWIAGAVFAACVAGFLVWNFPPAKIFMGDAGSGFLGLMVALLALWCAQARAELIWSWLILAGCFTVDASTTLVRRALRGERVYEAHRLHAYQYAARRHGGHRPVTLACAAINVLWLLPLAALVALHHIDGLSGLLIAYVPLLGLAFHYKAGDRASQRA